MNVDQRQQLPTLKTSQSTWAAIIVSLLLNLKAATHFSILLSVGG